MVDEILRNTIWAKIVGGREWVGGMVGSAVDVQPVGGSAADTPEGPLSVARGRIHACAGDLGDIGGEEECLVERHTVAYSGKDDEE